MKSRASIDLVISPFHFVPTVSKENDLVSFGYGGRVMRHDFNIRALPKTLYGVIWRRTVPLQFTIIGFGLMIPLLAVVPLDIQRRMVDDAIPALDQDLLIILAFAYGGAAVLSAGLKFLISYLRGLIQARVTRYLRTLVLDAQQHRSCDQARGAVGPVSAIIAEEASPLGGFAAEAINTPLIEGGAFLLVAGFMLVADPRLAAIGFAAMSLQAIVVPLIQRRINRTALRRVNAIRRANQDIIAAAARTGLSFYRDALRESRLDYRLRLKMNVLKAVMKTFLRLSDNVAVILVLGVGGLMVINGETTLGIVIAFLSGFKRLQEPWRALIEFYRTFANAHVKYGLIRGAMGATITIAPDMRTM